MVVTAANTTIVDLVAGTECGQRELHAHLVGVERDLAGLRRVAAVRSKVVIALAQSECDSEAVQGRVSFDMEEILRSRIVGDAPDSERGECRVLLQLGDLVLAAASQKRVIGSGSGDVAEVTREEQHAGICVERHAGVATIVDRGGDGVQRSDDGRQRAWIECLLVAEGDVVGHRGGLPSATSRSKPRSPFPLLPRLDHGARRLMALTSTGTIHALVGRPPRRSRHPSARRGSHAVARFRRGSAAPRAVGLVACRGRQACRS
jgi:hypothetical protein